MAHNITCSDGIITNTFDLWETVGVKTKLLPLTLFVFTISFLLLVSRCTVAENQSPTFQVKDAATAIQIAKGAFSSEFGKAELKKLKYFEASLSGDHWKVVGYAHKKHMAIPPHGGAFDFVISVMVAVF
jgi:hypothetical protein